MYSWCAFGIQFLLFYIPLIPLPCCSESFCPTSNSRLVWASASTAEIAVNGRVPNCILFIAGCCLGGIEGSAFTGTGFGNGRVDCLVGNGFLGGFNGTEIFEQTVSERWPSSGGSDIFWWWVHYEVLLQFIRKHLKICSYLFGCIGNCSTCS